MSDTIIDIKRRSLLIELETAKKDWQRATEIDDAIRQDRALTQIKEKMSDLVTISATEAALSGLDNFLQFRDNIPVASEIGVETASAFLAIFMRRFTEEVTK